MSAKTKTHPGNRYPIEIISHAVWLYFRFTLSFRDMEEMLAYRGLIVSYETIRQWTLKFGQNYANAFRRQQPKRGDKWHLDEAVLTIRGKHYYLWRAVDQNGYTLNVLLQSRRGKKQASRHFPRNPKWVQSDFGSGKLTPTLPSAAGPSCAAAASSVSTRRTTPWLPQ